MTAPRIRLALPWLQQALADAAAGDALPAMPALRWLGGRGRLETADPRPWREWLLEPVGGAGMLTGWPAGPALANQNGLDWSVPGCWCIAHPVHLAAGLDHLRLAPLAQAAPTGDEADELGALVSSHFGADEVAVVAFVEGAWLLHLARPVECVTQPPDSVVGHDVHGFMPAGRDGARIRSLMNEIQMLLHDHPVNQRRERARQQPVNGWWLWGFGDVLVNTAKNDARPWQLHCDDPWLRAIWQGLGLHPGEVTADAGATLRADTLIALSQPTRERPDEALARIDAGLLSALVQGVRNGTLHSVDLLAGSMTVQLGASARLQFWRRPVDLARWLA
jgi:hypothetical protein